MSGHKVTVFRPAKLEEGQKIRILEGPRRGDWIVLGADERKMRLRCPVSGREFEWERFAAYDAEIEVEEYPAKKFGEWAESYLSSHKGKPYDAIEAEVEERCRKLADGSPLAACVCQSGVFVYANPSALSLLGAASLSQVAGRQVLDFVHPDDRERFAERTALWGKGETAPRTSERLVRIDGTVFSAETAAWEVRFRGQPAIELIFSDVSEQRTLEKELRKTQEISRLGSWTYRPESGKTTWSLELYKIFGVNPETFNPSTKDFLKSVHPADLDRVSGALAEALGGQKPFRIDHRIVRPDGEVRHISVAGEWETDLHDGLPVLLGTALDVTEKVCLEAELRQAQKMEALGTLAGGIAHDFNNMLSAVLGYAELAFNLSEEGTPLQKYLLEVLKAGRRSRDLVSQILAFSRRTDEKKKPVDVARAVSDTLSILRASIPSTIPIETTTPGEPVYAWGATTQVQQVVANLVTNAYQAVRDGGGRIRVAIEKVESAKPGQLTVGEISEGCYAVITVSDDGPGVPEELVEKIFDPFFTTKEIGEGTGLGLSVVHGIVSAMGGGIEVKNAPDGGAAFAIHLPCAEQEAEKPKPKPETMPGPAQKSLEILFVDDERALAELGQTLLSTLGHKAESASDSNAALRLVESRAKPFDVVISDQTMPGVTGLQLLGRVATLWPGTGTILSTGFSEAVTDEALAAAGVGVLLMKPFSRDKLERAISEALAAKGAAN